MAAFLLTKTRALAARLADNRGIAAVEFALILPLMLTLYLGSVEMTKGVLASRKVTLVARALSDLVSQQTDCPSDMSKPPCLANDKMTEIFNAAAAIMAPYSPTSLRMTVSQIDVVDYNNVRYAYTKWSVTKDGGIARPCIGGGRKVALSPNSSLIEADAGMGTPGYQNSFPPNFTAPGASTGSIIVADVAYDYYPGFGYKVVDWNNSSTKLPMSQIQYMRTRGDGKPITLKGAVTNATDCSTNP